MKSHEASLRSCFVEGKRMRAALVSFSVAIFALFGSGCGGGFDCPFERPSCCDNVLFGCSIWDLPQGCSCEDYFLRSFSGAKLAQQSSKQPVMTAGVLADVSGTWRVTASKTVRSACPLFPQTNTGTILMREQSKKVSMKALGYTTLNGMRVGDVLRTQGAYKLPVLKCEGFIKTEMTPASASSSPFSTTINWVCKDSRQSCTVTVSYTHLTLPTKA